MKARPERNRTGKDRLLQDELVGSKQKTARHWAANSFGEWGAGGGRKERKKLKEQEITMCTNDRLKWILPPLPRLIHSVAGPSVFRMQLNGPRVFTVTSDHVYLQWSQTACIPDSIRLHVFTVKSYYVHSKWSQTRSINSEVKPRVFKVSLGVLTVKSKTCSHCEVGARVFTVKSD